MIATLTSPWALLCLGTYGFLVFLVLLFNHGAHRKSDPIPEHVRQPEERSWVCSDGVMRTAAEAADYVAATPGSDAYWLDAWIFGETVPDYVPREWVA